MFNVFALFANILASVACIISVSIMFVYDRLQAFATLSFYVTILTFITAFIGMQYNVKRINSNRSLTPTWYMILRIVTVTSLIINCLISIAFTEGGAWSISYFLTRLALPILMLLAYIFFDIDKKVPYYAAFISPAFILLYFVVFLPMFSCSVIPAPYQYLDVNHNSWATTFLLVISVIALSSLIALGLRGLNYLIHKKFYKKIEESPLLVEECIPEEIIEEPVEEPEPIEEEIIKEEPEEFDDDEAIITNHIIINNTTENVEKVDTSTKSSKKVSTPSKTIKKVEEKDVENKASKTKKVNRKNTNKIDKKVEVQIEEKPTLITTKSSTQTKKIKKVDTSTKTTKKVETSTKTIKKIEKPSKPVKKSEPKEQIDTSTRVISRTEINELIGASKKNVTDEEKVYHVSHHKTENKWQVKLAGGGRALKLFKTQLQAINYAKELVKSKGGSICIHSVNGQIRKG